LGLGQRPDHYGDFANPHALSWLDWNRTHSLPVHRHVCEHLLVETEHGPSFFVFGCGSALTVVHLFEIVRHGI